MPAKTSTSILDATLTCIGQRISNILLQPGDKDENYITSLHNEVVSILPKKAASLSSKLELSLLLCGSLESCHLAVAPLLFSSQLGSPFIKFQTSATQAAISCLIEAGSSKAKTSHHIFPNLISQSGGTLEKERQ